MLNRSLLFAGAVGALFVGAPAVAHADAAQCRLYAANLWPDTLDAFENEMRARTYAGCLQGQQPVDLHPPAARQLDHCGVDGRVCSGPADPTEDYRREPWKDPTRGLPQLAPYVGRPQ
jgi:hypothetical protein